MCSIRDMISLKWLILIISLPGQSGTPRMRVWRALKARGAGILRDGVYVLPEADGSREVLEEQVATVEGAGGNAYLLPYADPGPGQTPQFRALFDRAEEYEQWTGKVAALRDTLPDIDEPEARRREAQLRRELDAINSIDYFPGEPQAQASAALEQIATAINARFSPGEPIAAAGRIETQDRSAFHARVWATRKSMWVDRVASAWLIRRFIDPRARFVWLDSPADCPPDAVGFDFDDARFTHIGDSVTFEVLMHGFDLASDRALSRLAALVHYLDVGGVPVAEAPGFVAMLGGAKRGCAGDDDLLDAASGLLDHLYAAFEEPS
ncbi:MAG: chromate resistance protein ChrB domain-containing protein [Gammaproteobacteria bacterium]